MKIYMILIMFFMISALIIVSNNNLALNTMENLRAFGSAYLSWLSQIYSNTYSITGNAVKLPWLPE